MLAIIGGGIIAVGSATLLFSRVAISFRHFLLRFNLTLTAIYIFTAIIHYFPSALLGGFWAGWIMRRRGWLSGLTLGILLIIVGEWSVGVNRNFEPVALYAILTILLFCTLGCTLGGYLGERLTKRKRVKR